MRDYGSRRVILLYMPSQDYHGAVLNVRGNLMLSVSSGIVHCPSLYA